MLIEEVSRDAEQKGMELDRYDAEGVALINAKLAAIQRMRVQLWRLGRTPRSRRTSLHAEQISLAWFELAQLRFAVAKLVNHLREFREDRSRNELASALRLQRPTAPKSHRAATHTAVRKS